MTSIDVYRPTRATTYPPSPSMPSQKGGWRKTRERLETGRDHPPSKPNRWGFAGVLTDFCFSTITPLLMRGVLWTFG
jgi:hypothetical protein